MTKVEDVIRLFRGIFHILGIWPIGQLKKWHRRIAISAFFLLQIFPLIMCSLSLLQVKSVEDFSRAIIYIISFSWVGFFTISFYKLIPKVKEFISELSKTVYEDDNAESFVDEASTKALKITKFVIFCEFCTANIASFVIPMVFDCLPFPMWTPNWANSTAIFSIYWIIEWLAFNYTAQIVNIFFFSFAILVIINGYGKFLNVRLSMLVSTEDHDGYPDLVKCILAHQKFKK